MACRKHKCEQCIREEIARLEKKINALKEQLPKPQVIYLPQWGYTLTNGCGGTVNTTWTSGYCSNETLNSNGGKIGKSDGTNPKLG